MTITIKNAKLIRVFHLKIETEIKISKSFSLPSTAVFWLTLEKKLYLRPSSLNSIDTYSMNTISIALIDYFN